MIDIRVVRPNPQEWPVPQFDKQTSLARLRDDQPALHHWRATVGRERQQYCLPPESILPTLVETIATALKLPHVSLWLPASETQWVPAADFGPQTDDLHTIPLLHQNQEIGCLLVAQRGPGERFSREEARLLATIAQLSATTVQAAQLSAELQRSRRQIVTSREEERRRLRRDLHDGLGLLLASVALQADTARE